MECISFEKRIPYDPVDREGTPVGMRAKKIGAEPEYDALGVTERNLMRTNKKTNGYHAVNTSTIADVSRP